METSAVLDRAADLIEERGWTTGAWGIDWNGEPEGALCLEGAVIAALPRSERGDVDCGVSYSVYDDCPAGEAVERYLDDRGGGGYAWNDAPGRTATEVIAVLRAAALIERAKENTETRAAVSV